MKRKGASPHKVIEDQLKKGIYFLIAEIYF